MVLPEQVMAVPLSKFITYTVPEPEVMLLNVFPVIVFVGPLTPEAPSRLFQPITLVLPATVTLEKLFPVSVIVEPLTEAPWVIKNSTLLPAVGLLKPVTMLLFVQVQLAPEAMFPCLTIKYTPLFVFRLKLVNVLVDTVWESTATLLTINWY